MFSRMLSRLSPQARIRVKPTEICLIGWWEAALTANIEQAKKPETRERRLDKAITMLREGRKP